MTRLGYQIPNFTYPDTKPEEIFGKVIAQAKAAEAAGYDRVMPTSNQHLFNVKIGIQTHTNNRFTLRHSNQLYRVVCHNRMA